MPYPRLPAAGLITWRLTPYILHTVVVAFTLGHTYLFPVEPERLRTFTTHTPRRLDIHTVTYIVTLRFGLTTPPVGSPAPPGWLFPTAYLRGSTPHRPGCLRIPHHHTVCCTTRHRYTTMPLYHTHYGWDPVLYTFCYLQHTVRTITFPQFGTKYRPPLLPLPHPFVWL